ncbi:MAG: hypothetical protein HKP56_14760, partial [Anderseniella sp.]|nr:hypothetical protein [Anderseniella sp.]
MKRLDLLSAFAVAGVLTTAATVSPSPTMAQSIQCGEHYTIARGDSLSGIAQRAYRDAASFQLIYSVNSGT